MKRAARLAEVDHLEAGQRAGGSMQLLPAFAQLLQDRLNRWVVVAQRASGAGGGQCFSQAIRGAPEMQVMVRCRRWDRTG